MEEAIEEPNDEPAAVDVVTLVVTGAAVVVAPADVEVVPTGAGAAEEDETAGALAAMYSQSSLTTERVPNACSVEHPWRTQGVALAVIATLLVPHWHA